MKQYVTVNEFVAMTVKRYGPMSSSQIARITGLERPTITKSLSILKSDGLIKIAYDAPCKLTGYMVHHYVSRKNEQNG